MTRLPKPTILIILALILSLAILSTAYADCRGCCSGHGGTICQNGVTICKDGTPLSDKCMAKKCNKCGGSAGTRPTKSSTPKPPSEKVVKRGNTRNDSFNSAKRIMERQVYHDHRLTFYCGCPFDQARQILPSDNYTPRRESSRSERIEWEHVVAAQHFGQSFREWREGHPECVDSKGKSFKGRNCARKMNMEFRFMESDLYNLVPAVGEINGLRSNFRFGMIAGEKRAFGACDMEIDFKGDIAEPSERIRGDIARIYKYMDWAYPGHGVIGRARKKLFDAWDRQDPVDAWECEKCKRIEAIQGNRNPFVAEKCMEAGLW